MKLCVDCVHLVPDMSHRMEWAQLRFGFCAKTEDVNSVDGSKTYRTAGQMRLSSEKCGPDALLWEPKE